MEFSDYTSDMDEDAFFKEFVKNDFQLLVTTLCEIKQYASIKIKEIVSEKELLQLFASHCPYSDDDTETVKQIIREVHSHTLTVVLSALSLAAGGLEPDELLHELTGIIETHDMLQQMLNLVNRLILADDLELARLVLNQYDALVTDNEGNNTLDYGCCRLAAGIIALKEGKPVKAEKNLLAAESIIDAAMDTRDSDSASSDTANFII